MSRRLLFLRPGTEVEPVESSSCGQEQELSRRLLFLRPGTEVEPVESSSCGQEQELSRRLLFLRPGTGVEPVESSSCGQEQELSRWNPLPASRKNYSPGEKFFLADRESMAITLATGEGEGLDALFSCTCGQPAADRRCCHHMFAACVIGAGIQPAGSLLDPYNRFVVQQDCCATDLLYGWT